MHTIKIAIAAIAGLAGASADAQVRTGGTQMQMGGGQMRAGGGQMQIGGGQWQRQGGGGQWQGGGGQWQGQGQVQRQTQIQTGGGRTFGGDPRTWGPGNQPRPPVIGGDPRTWGPGNQPRGWHGNRGGSWGGGYIGGQWAAGVRAPGGWGAYRRPHRGWQIPGYWRSPDYRIFDYAAFGLSVPPQGYGWSRYYDDAVLVDYDGRVYDSVSGLDWRRFDQPYATGYGYPSQGYWNAPDYGYDYGAQGGQAYAGDGYAYAQGGQGFVYAPPQSVVQSYGYAGGYIPGATATATVEFGAPETTTTTTTTTTTEEWVSEPRVIYRTVVKKVPTYRRPVKKWRPQPVCADACECGKVCGS